MDKEFVEKVKLYYTPAILDPIPFFIMSNNLIKIRNEAYMNVLKAQQRTYEHYKKWFSIPYALEYKYRDNNWLKRHGYPMRRRH